VTSWAARLTVDWRQQGSSEANVDQPTAARLHDLIRLTNRGYLSHSIGHLRYDVLPKAPLLTRPRSIHAVIGYVEGLIDKAQSRARVRAVPPKGDGSPSSGPKLAGRNNDADERRGHTAAITQARE
jgi:hypothetical protein